MKLSMVHGMNVCKDECQNFHVSPAVGTVLGQVGIAGLRTHKECLSCLLNLVKEKVKKRGKIICNI